MGIRTRTSLLLVIFCVTLAAAQMEHAYKALACEGRQVFISCPPGARIRVLEAFYGRNNSASCVDPTKDYRINCKADGATAVVGKMCDEKQDCLVQASNSLFGAPSPCTDHTFKYMLVDYICEKAQYTALVCEGSGRLPLSCPAGMVLEINDAFFGREDLSVCPHPLAYMPQTPCSASRAVEIVNVTCRGLPECELIARTAVFGEPCSGNFHYLKVNYSCVSCSNAHAVDAQCQQWALEGECDSNAAWMYDKCRQSCLGCDPKEHTCTNIAADSDCSFWADRGDCVSGDFISWMMVNCRKACTRCDKPATCMDKLSGVTDELSAGVNKTCRELEVEGACVSQPAFMLTNCWGTCRCSSNARSTARVRCENRFVGNNPDDADNDPDAQCRQWVSEGECVSNAGFMFTQCYKACSNCTKTPVCENAYDDANCDVYFDDGECTSNPLWMLKNCYRACTGCVPEPECVNDHDNDAECEYWRDQGRCVSQRDFMYEACWASCSRCRPKPVVPACENADGSDADCDSWRESGDCVSNAEWMYTYCRKSCTFCGYPYVQLNYQGQNPLPGESSLMTRGRTFVMGATVKEAAVLTHFAVFFTSDTSVSLEIWRPGPNQRLTKVFSAVVTPSIIRGAQVVPVEECFMLMPGDRVGFTTTSNEPSPVAYRFDLSAISEPTYFRPAGGSRLFSTMKLPYSFSIAAAYDYTTECTPS